MNTFDRWLMHLANILVGGTGLVYAVMRYFLRPLDEFSVVNHPWQPHLQHAHVWCAPLLVLLVGFVWRQHAAAALKAGVPEGRRSGLLMLLTALPMIFSGYLIQTAVTPLWRTIWISVHVTASLLWLAGYLIHQAAHLRVRRRAAGT